MKSGVANAEKVYSTKFSYARAIRHIDPVKVLEHYGARNLVERSGEYIHSCLIDKVHPHHANGDENASASMQAGSLLYHCYSYGGGSLLWFVQQMEECGYEQAVSFLKKFIDDSWGEDGENLLQIVRSYLDKPENQTIPTYSSIVLRPWKKIHPYMIERGILPETIKRYTVGYDPEQDKIVIPHFWEGKLVGWQKRRLDSTPWEPGLPKYKSSTDFPKRSTLFNYDTVCERGIEDVVLVESPMSVLKAESLVDQGFSQFNNVIATFGAKVTDLQVEYLRRFRSVTVYFDKDKAGWKGALDVYDRLKRFTTVYLIWPLTSQDMADLDEDGLDFVMSTRRAGALIRGKFDRALKEAKDEEIHAKEQVRDTGRSRVRSEVQVGTSEWD